MRTVFEKYANNTIIKQYSSDIFTETFPMIFEDYQNGILKDCDLIIINGVLGVLKQQTYISDVLELYTYENKHKIGIIKQRHPRDVRELCVNCIYLQNQMCKMLKEAICPEYEIKGNTDFHLRGFDIYNPEKFGCKFFKCKN